jgi:hypothetical protein
MTSKELKLVCEVWLLEQIIHELTKVEVAGVVGSHDGKRSLD